MPCSPGVPAAPAFPSLPPQAVSANANDRSPSARLEQATVILFSNIANLQIVKVRDARATASERLARVPSALTTARKMVSVFPRPLSQLVERCQWAGDTLELSAVNSELSLTALVSGEAS